MLKVALNTINQTQAKPIVYLKYEIELKCIKKNITIQTDKKQLKH